MPAGVVLLGDVGWVVGRLVMRPVIALALERWGRKGNYRIRPSQVASRERKSAARSAPPALTVDREDPALLRSPPDVSSH
ncbi:MAG: hypothetical protein AMXMBFR34_28910 [Myxococcaceae bacterium]